MSDYEVRVAQSSEGAVADHPVMDILSLAFSTDPCVRYIFPTAVAYLAHYRRLATAMAGAALAAGTAWVADGDGAAALWLPPGVHGDGEAIGALVGETVAPEKLATLAEVGEQMDRCHPEAPHWYLPLIGVDPSRQGQGLGSALLKAGLARCDQDGLPAYLESSNPKNVPLYERHGFEVIGLIQPGDYPPLVPMLRPARHPTAA